MKQNYLTIIGLIIILFLGGCSTTKGSYYCFYGVVVYICQEPPTFRKAPLPSFWGWM